jgi:hypothetical protein
MRMEGMLALGTRTLLVTWIAALAAAQQPTPRRGRLPPGFPGGPNPAATSNDPLAGPPRPTAAPPVDLSGAWKGMFCWDISVELADLTLTASPDRRDLTGELKFSPLPSEATRMARPGPPIVWTIRGRVDPGSNAVWLTPPPAPLRTTIGAVFEQRPLAGVFAAGRDEIAGQFREPNRQLPDPSATWFLFVHAGGSKDGGDAVARLKSLAEHAAEAAPPMKGKGGGSLPSDGDLVKWVTPFEVEYAANPGGPGGGGVEQISQRAMPLLADATFKPLFGETYDRTDLGVLAKGMRRFTDPKLAREHGFMQYALYPSPGKLVSIAAMRTIDAWQAEMLARFQGGPAVASAFDDLAATEKAIRETAIYAWPSTAKRTNERIEQLRGSLSGSSLGANVDQAIASAAGLAGAKTLATWAKDNAAMLERLSPAERGAAQKKVDAKLDELLQSLIDPLVAQLATLGTGEPAVRAGAAWHKAFAEQFVFASARPPYAQALGKLSSRREPDFAAGSDALLRRIQGCRAPEAVDALFASDLSVPGDDATKTYAVLADAGRKRKQAIEEERILALFSREEQAIMDRPGHIDLSRAKPRPPTAEEVRLATVRGWASGNGKMLDAHTARHVDLTSSEVVFFPFPLIVKFSQESLIRADPIEKSADWECEFSILMQMAAADDNMLVNYDEVVRKHSLTMIQMANGLLSASASEPEKRILRLTENGWVIPELMEAGAIRGALEQMLKGR